MWKKGEHFHSIEEFSTVNSRNPFSEHFADPPGTSKILV